MFFTIAISIIFNLHSYALSFTEMKYNEQTKRVEVSIKVTGHDLEKEMYEIYKSRLEFRKHSTFTDSLCTVYLKDKFVLKQNNKLLKLHFDEYKFDISGDLFLRFHFKEFSPKLDFILSNRILFQFFPKQQNMVFFNIGDKKYRKTLTKSNDKLLSKEQ